jgi:hypothetical protein
MSPGVEIALFVCLPWANPCHRLLDDAGSCWVSCCEAMLLCGVDGLSEQQCEGHCTTCTHTQDASSVCGWLQLAQCSEGTTWTSVVV